MYPRYLTTTQTEKMSAMKRVINLHRSDGWKWYAWAGYWVYKIVVMGCQTKFGIDVRNDFSIFALATATYFIPLLGICKLYTLLRYDQKIEAMFSTVAEQFWETSLVNNGLRNGLDSRLQSASNIMAVHSWLSLILCLANIFFPLAKFPEGQRQLPTAMWLPFDSDASPLHEIIYTLIGITHPLTVLCIITCDSMYVYFAENLSVQFEILKELLRNVTEVHPMADKDKYDSKMYQNIINDRLKDCVNHHAVLTKFLKDIQEVFSFSLGLQFPLSVFSLVFIVYLLELDHDDLTKAARVLVFVEVLSFEVTLYAAYGSQLEHQGGTVAGAAYDSEWYFGGKRFRQGLNILQMNSQKPATITAMGMVYVNNAALITVCRTVFSMLTLIHQLVN